MNRRQPPQLPRETPQKCTISPGRGNARASPSLGMDDAEFALTKKHHVYRCIGLIFTLPIIVVLGFALFPGIGAWILIGVSAPAMHVMWTNIFKGSKKYGSVLYKRVRDQKKLEEFRQKTGI